MMPLVNWMDQASCAGIDPIYWFPEAGIPKSHAVEVCNSCPVKWECRVFSLSYRLENGSYWLDGIWGGLSTYDRANVTRCKELLEEALMMLKERVDT